MEKITTNGGILPRSFLHKLLRIMRITLIMIIASALTTLAAESYSQSARVSLDLKNVSVKDVLKAIEDQSEFYFIYNNELIDVNRKLSVQVSEQSVGNVLEEVFQGQNIEVTVIDRKIVLAPAEILGSAQQQSGVSGNVTDNTGFPLPGVTVVVKGTTTGTVTGPDGNYQLRDLSDNAVLVFSFVGMRTQEIAVNGQTVINVTLSDDTQLVEDVVVIGYGVQKKVNLTGSISTVGGEDLSRRPVANATQSLQGLVPGLLVTNSQSGRPGSDASLTLRGQGNLSNNANPYILVDGVEMNLGDINPNDIESITVLKDAAAAAIYGARAAYGVVLVTTKKGEDGKMRVSYQGTTGWTSPTVLPEMANAYEFATYFNDASANAGVALQYSQEKLDLLQRYVNNPSDFTLADTWAELNPNQSLVGAFENTARGIGNVDYFKLHYKNAAFRQNHNLSLSGGNKIAQYYASGGLYSEEGVMKYADMDFQRFNFNASVTSQLTQWLKMKVNTKFVHSDTDTPFGTGGLSEGFYHSMARFRPTVNERDPNGNFTELTMIPYLQSGTYTNRISDNLALTSGFEIRPLKNWNIFLDYTYRFNNSEYEALNVAPFIPRADGVTLDKGTRAELGISSNGRYTRNMSNSRYQTINLYSNFSFTLADAHNFTVMGGYQEESNNYRYLMNVAQDLISTSNPGLMLATGDKVINEARNGWATLGFFGRLNYDFKGKYLFEANARYDGSSRFAADSRWGFFPSASVGWRISEEAFMEDFDALSNLKIRGSYGLLGNQSGAALYTFASTMSIVTQGSYFFNTGRQMYIQAPGVVDPFTTWEKVNSINLGVDFGFYDNALTGSFDLFERETRDMLGPTADLADLFGASAPQTNNAEMRNRGWELSVNYVGKINKDVSYSIGGSVSDAISEVTQYENPTGTNPANNWYVGKNVGEIWGYRASGLIQTSTEADEYNSTYDMTYLSGKAWTPGDVRYLDLNNDKKINNGSNTLSDMGDMTIIGNTTPRYQYTVNGMVGWKGLSLSLLFQGVGKRDWVPNSGDVYFWGSGAYAQVTVFPQHLDYWTESNPGAYYPKPYTAGAGAIASLRNKTSQVADRYMQKAAYGRLKNMTLSYDLPKTWMDKAGLSKTTLFFSGENLLTFTKLPKMFDPEGLFTGNTYTSERGKNYPMNKVVSLGIIVNL